MKEELDSNLERRRLRNNGTSHPTLGQVRMQNN